MKKLDQSGFGIVAIAFALAVGIIIGLYFLTSNGDDSKNVTPTVDTEGLTEQEKQQTEGLLDFIR